ncbi:MAG: tRNA (guanosine(46)-N7)-methyltransferase TrmB [Acidiferrobacterales bacterium]|nr:tRNA (guanosine(46)-N7)-methyltransferase TrmB [Acidiferrobacterales bacterium]
MTRTAAKPGESQARSPRRTIRSYVRREGRITRAQQRALSELWTKYGLDDGLDELDFVEVFGRKAPVALEIGFGNGENLCHLARLNPDTDFIGVEVHRPGIGSLLLKLDRDGIENVRVICADATLVLANQIPKASLTSVYLLFPDPWPKKRHHKRRLLQHGFAAQIVERLRSGGDLYVATDWQDYAEHVLKVSAQLPGLINVAGEGGYGMPPQERVATRFERRGQRLGHRIWKLHFRRAP